MLFPDVARAFTRKLVRTYDDFVSLLLEDIDEGIAQIENNPELRQKDSEDRLTIELVNHLRTKSYSATHETKQGGKIDILVEQLAAGYSWRGEAKIHSSYEYLFEGFQQLCTRYNRATPNNDHGGLIFYVFGSDCKSVRETWEKRLPEFFADPIAIEPCTSLRSAFSFLSTHTHPSSGLPYRVRHMGVVMHFDPKDRSGRITRARRASKNITKKAPKKAAKDK